MKLFLTKGKYTILAQRFFLVRRFLYRRKNGFFSGAPAYRRFACRDGLYLPGENCWGKPDIIIPLPRIKKQKGYSGLY